MDEKEKKPKKKNIHSGHRHRVRQRFLKENSLESFEEYQIVELLLFYAYPMKDTNEMFENTDKHRCSQDNKPE